MAARLRRPHQQEVRDKIRASQLINRLQKHVDSDSPVLDSSQVTAALGLLRKCVPDLQTTQHVGDEGGAIKTSLTVLFGKA